MENVSSIQKCLYNLRKKFFDTGNNISDEIQLNCWKGRQWGLVSLKGQRNSNNTIQ